LKSQPTMTFATQTKSSDKRCQLDIGTDNDLCPIDKIIC
jgi:hypothetical protein